MYKHPRRNFNGTGLIVDLFDNISDILRLVYHRMTHWFQERKLSLEPVFGTRNQARVWVMHGLA
jgi:hypothetical protein